MLLYFHINYKTHFGQILKLSGSTPEAGSFQEEKAIEMIHIGSGNWYMSVDVKESIRFEYRYLMEEKGIIQRREWGNNHVVILPKNASSCTFFDCWQPEPQIPFLYTSAFTDSFLAVEEQDTSILYKPGAVVLKVFAPFVRKGQILSISGDCPLLGNWDGEKALPMLAGKFPEWCISFQLSELPDFFNYKYIITDQNTGKVSSWEGGEPRNLIKPHDSDQKKLLMFSGTLFNYQGEPWKGAGVAIPVFSLRSETSWGCGDFGDLKKMVEWAEMTGQQLVQLLPINDTSISGTWTDSYPYNAVSIFALHPAYLAINLLQPLKDAVEMETFEQKRKVLNELPEMDYEKVMQLKTAYIKKLYAQEGETVMQTKDFKAFFEKNEDWLIPYATFSYLRKKYKESDFRKWEQHSAYDTTEIKKLCKPEQSWYKDIAIYFFTQYLLNLQLTETRDFAHKHSVVLKGDIPIGISRFSVEAWTNSNLFNMDSQIGSPPDDFSEKGQNWGFPAYNWEQMAAEDYQWWKRRFRKMADYFDAYRIDHILGFFRIWEIPTSSVEGMLGHFQPALPLSLPEIKNTGFHFEESMTDPYITDHVIHTIFEDKADEIREKYLLKGKDAHYHLRTDLQTQEKIRNHFGDIQSEAEQFIRDGLYRLCNDVLFVRDSQSPELFHPRISGNKTFRYHALDFHQKKLYKSLHDHFFYIRNVDFWKQKALEKLPHILNATRMLVCGEDLGMIPSCVPEVMHQLNILSLEIQRMPKKTGITFENLNDIPYMSVCTTSSHDINPLRAWWLENPKITQHYYQEILWKHGKAPKECTPEMAQIIVQNHLASPAMWIILPWQDWMAIDGKVRRSNPEEERINIPSNPKHYWRYRMHLTLEQLMKETSLNETILQLNKNSGRY